MLDGLALFGIWAGLYLICRAVRHPPLTLFKSSLSVFALFAVFLGSRSVWFDASAFARVLSPLLIWLLMYGMPGQMWRMAIPLVLAFPRVAYEILLRSLEAVQSSL